MLHKVLATKLPSYSDLPPHIYMRWVKKTLPSSESTRPLSLVLPTFFTFLKGPLFKKPAAGDFFSENCTCIIGNILAILAFKLL